MAPPKTPAKRKPAPKRGAASPKPAAKAAGGNAALAWSLGGLVLAAGAGLVAFLTRGRISELLADATPVSEAPVSEGSVSEGHVPTDLLDPSRNADDRAIADFRPDMDAVMTAADRAALAPATGPAPGFAADRGSVNA